ncbi:MULTISPECIES: hypothetical protein [Paenibacillus]|uniref:Uncharacterized protein n=1 Tax=Paenibacillus naphthalenovorans TaxID=162209 RepID=A0A0U2WGV2_9BACL|nr:MULTISPECIES: hypothetical protein [Paenibacillus]ALS24554.1 hypothetical protein IJ22_42600 [Paenibacillus naphthalenovorans]GCL73601.1 hypothetical protein PN4B1_35400 [Paenibacillus naphthalenovorans]SDJ11288.1 hypothetical protein SAMN05421868_11773 [Paenibacillus naphthalenovorans]
MEKHIDPTEEIYIYNNEDINDVKEDATGEEGLSAGKAGEPIPSPSARNGDRP